MQKNLNCQWLPRRHWCNLLPRPTLLANKIIIWENVNFNMVYIWESPRVWTLLGWVQIGVVMAYGPNGILHNPTRLFYFFSSKLNRIMAWSLYGPILKLLVQNEGSVTSPRYKPLKWEWQINKPKYVNIQHMVSSSLGAKVTRKLNVGMIDATLVLVGLFAAPVRFDNRRACSGLGLWGTRVRILVGVAR
jgi:hypothetical protein